MSRQFHHNRTGLLFGGSNSAGRRSTCALEDAFNSPAATLLSSALVLAWPSTSTRISRSTQASMFSHDRLSMMVTGLEMTGVVLGMYGLHMIHQHWIERLLPVCVGAAHGILAYNNTKVSYSAAANPTSP